MANDRDIQQMIKDLGRAVAQAISASDDVNEVVRKIRHEGFSLSMTLNCEHDGKREAKLELTPRRATPTGSATPEGDPEAMGPPVATPSSLTLGPKFRLDSSDVSLLKSLGIDPTRAAPRRRGQ